MRSVALALSLWVGSAREAAAWTYIECKFNSASVDFGWHPTNRTDFVTSANRWTNATQINLRNAGEQSVARGINPFIQNYGNTNWDGRVPACSGSIRTQVRLDINRYYSDAYTSWTRTGLMGHEIGHALGLGHVGATGSIMYPTTPGRASNLPGQDEANGINSFY